MQGSPVSLKLASRLPGALETHVSAQRTSESARCRGKVRPDPRAVEHRELRGRAAVCRGAAGGAGCSDRSSCRWAPMRSRSILVSGSKIVVASQSGFQWFAPGNRKAILTCGSSVEQTAPGAQVSRHWPGAHAQHGRPVPELRELRRPGPRRRPGLWRAPGGGLGNPWLTGE